MRISFVFKKAEIHGAVIEALKSKGHIVEHTEDFNEAVESIKIMAEKPDLICISDATVEATGKSRYKAILQQLEDLRKAVPETEIYFFSKSSLPSVFIKSCAKVNVQLGMMDQECITLDFRDFEEKVQEIKEEKKEAPKEEVPPKEVSVEIPTKGSEKEESIAQEEVEKEEFTGQGIEIFEEPGHIEVFEESSTVTNSL